MLAHSDTITSSDQCGLLYVDLCDLLRLQLLYSDYLQWQYLGGSDRRGLLHVDLFDVAVQLGFLQEPLTAVVTLVAVYPVVIVKVTLKLEFQPESCIKERVEMM